MENLGHTLREHPFEYTGKVGAGYFWDRSEERPALQNLYAGGRIGVLSGSRRVGKSSLAEIVAEDMQRDRALRFALLDVRETTAATFFNRLTERVTSLFTEKWTERLVRQLAQEFRRFRHTPELHVDPEKLSPVLRFSRIPKEDEDLVLQDIFDLLVRAPARSGRPVLLILDEFQDVLSRAPLLPEVIKSRFKGGEGVSILLTGSEQHPMEEITGSPSAPLYRIGSLLVLGPLPFDAVAEEIKKRFDWHRIRLEDEAIGAIYRSCDGVPKNLQWLCATLLDMSRRNSWKLIQPNEVNLALNYLYDTALGEEYGREWAMFSEPQRELAAAISRLGGKGIMSAHFLEQINSLRRPSQATVQRAAQALVAKEIVQPSAEGYVFKDPFFRLYVSRM